MVLLIAGPSHTGKTALAHKLVSRYGYPCLSIDHLKMGLIRSGHTALTPLSPDADLTAYLWPIVREMVKTAIENRQNLIVEGCYIPFDWQNDFSAPYLEQIRYRCLVMSEHYIRTHFDQILAYANIIEHRLCDDCDQTQLLQDNAHALAQVRAMGLPYLLIHEQYPENSDF